MTSDASYRLLPVEDHSSLSDEVEHAHEGKRKQETRQKLERFVLKLTAATCILSLAMMFVKAGVLGQRFQDSYLDTPARTSELERPSSYIGFEKLYRDSSRPLLPPLINFPIALAQVEANKLAAGLVVDVKPFWSPMGMIYPEDRPFKVSSTISTVVQFRVLDWGMENCVLKLEIPSLAIIAGSGSDKTINISPDEVEVEVWQTKTKERLTSTTSTSQSSRRPPQGLLKATWIVQPGQIFETEQFNCSSGSLQTFELVCKSEDCNFQFQQDVYEPRLAVYLEQHQSV